MPCHGPRLHTQRRVHEVGLVRVEDRGALAVVQALHLEHCAGGGEGGGGSGSSQSNAHYGWLPSVHSACGYAPPFGHRQTFTTVLQGSRLHSATEWEHHISVAWELELAPVLSMAGWKYVCSASIMSRTPCCAALRKEYM